MKTEIITAGNISRAAEIISRGGLVAVPTETVYGLAANGLDRGAVPVAELGEEEALRYLRRQEIAA